MSSSRRPSITRTAPRALVRGAIVPRLPDLWCPGARLRAPALHRLPLERLMPIVVQGARFLSELWRLARDRVRRSPVDEVVTHSVALHSRLRELVCPAGCSVGRLYSLGKIERSRSVSDEIISK